MARGASLKIPPPSSGLEQMSEDKVIVTKPIANARIPVGRAISQMKVLNFKEISTNYTCPSYR